MKLATSRSPGAGISRGMWIALAATLALTASSYGVRSWREATLAASVEEAATAADTVPTGTALAPTVTPVQPPAIVVPRSKPEPATLNRTTSPPPQPPPSLPAAAPSPAAAALVGLRPSVPGPAIDAMAGRRSAPPSSLAATPNEAPATVAAMPAPSFRLIGRYLDGTQSVAFLTYGDAVIAAKAGDSLPDGFKLKSIRPNGIVVLRRANQEKIEMLLTP